MKKKMVSALMRIFCAGICCLNSSLLEAQLCNGSLGDPAVNINFGNGADPNNSGYTPTNAYTYTSNSCPNDGSYTITRSTSNCFSSSWHTVSSDHTGGGAFMLVNASFEPGDFFVTTVSDLCPNTTYQFAAWIMNVLNRSGIKPNITFQIEAPDGTILQQYETGDIPETGGPQWKQYGFYFSTPVNNPVIVLRMTNNAPGGLGNDLALDDITFSPCGEKVGASIDNLLGDTVNVCQGNRDEYDFTGFASAAYASPVYQWQLSKDSGASWTDISGAAAISYHRSVTLAPGGYWYRFTVVDASVQGITSCRIVSNILVINIHANPKVDAGPSKIYIEGHPVLLEASIEGDKSVFEWSPTLYMDDPAKLNPRVSPAADIRYTLAAQTIYGCPGEDTVLVKVVKGIFVPSAFTPNGDGKNDRWRIPYLLPDFEAEVRVFNRWGNLMYQSDAAVVEWDGKLNGTPQPSGVYVYVIQFRNKDFGMIKGTVTLIR